MSRIGRKPIPVPETVTVTIEPEVVRVAGPRGNLEERKARVIEVAPGGRPAARHAGRPTAPSTARCTGSPAR